MVILTSSKEDAGIQKYNARRADRYIVKAVNFGSYVQAIKKLGFYRRLLNHWPLNLK